MQRNIRNIVVGSALGIALIGGSAAAFAASQPASPSSPQSRIQTFLDDVASHLGVQPSALKSAIEAAEIDRVNQAVSSGKLTQAQAQKIEARINSGKIGMFGGVGRFGPHGRRPMFMALKNAAAYLGLTPAQLRTDLKGGQSLAQVATAQGKTVQGLEQALLAPIQTRLNKAVSSGKLTAAKEQTILQRLQTRIGKMVNHVRKQPGSPATAPAGGAPQP